MICPHCHKDVEGTWIDEGIGPYEYWGAKGNDTHMHFVCEECDGELESEQSYNEYVASMKEDYLADEWFDKDWI